MQLSHNLPVVSACFDEPNLVSSAGLVPVMRLAQDAGLRVLADEHLSVPTDKGARAGLKVSSLVGLIRDLARGPVAEPLGDPGELAAG